MSRPYPKVKDKIKIEFNPTTGELDLISEFNANRIVTHELTQFGNKLVSWDPSYNTYYESGPQTVYDSNGNVVVI